MELLCDGERERKFLTMACLNEKTPFIFDTPIETPFQWILWTTFYRNAPIYFT